MLLLPVGKDALKRRKPKNNMAKSNSSFISRVITNEGLSKRLQEHPADGLFAFANINRAFQWLDLSSPNKVRPLKVFRWRRTKPLAARPLDQDTVHERALLVS